MRAFLLANILLLYIECDFMQSNIEVYISCYPFQKLSPRSRSCTIFNVNVIDIVNRDLLLRILRLSCEYAD